MCIRDRLLLWGRGDAFTLSILGENGLSLNLYTILFIAFFGIGYGAYYATADMPIPMVADCSDYETYRSGNYIPGIMGTLFSLVDKLVSSLSATVVGIAVSFVGLQSLPTQYDPYTPGMNWVVIVLFCIIPMVAWAATLIAMKGYTLTGAKMKEIQAVNACRRDAVAKGMKLEEAMDKWQTMDQPVSYTHLDVYKRQENDFALVKNDRLEISRRQRTAFLTAVASYMGGVL